MLLLSWQGQSAREAAWRGFWFGVGAFGAGTYWLYISIHIFGGSPLWLALFLMCALVLIMALFSALAGWLYARLRSDSPLLSLLLLFPASWVLVEWLRGWIFTGFPWLSLGYAQVDGPLAGWAPLGGVYAVSLVSALITGCLACLLLAHRGRERLAVVILLAVIALAKLGSSGAGLDPGVRARGYGGAGAGLHFAGSQVAA